MAKVTLRAPCLEDAAIHFAHPPEPEIARMYGGDPKHPPKPSLKRSQDWVAWLQDHRFSRIILADNHLVGAVRLHKFNEPNTCARLAIGLLSTCYLDQGIGRQAIRQTLTIAFDDFKLARIELRVLAFNARAIRCYQACGFKHIGTESVEILGKPEDEWIMCCERQP